MFEGVNNNLAGENQDEPFDYLAEAARLREEREIKETAEKSQKEAKEKQKREERLARQFAKSAAKREEIAKKAQDLDMSSDKAKEQVEEAKTQAKELHKEAHALTAADKASTENVEMTVTNGSEYLAELNDGEGATLVFEHEIKELDGSIKKAEDTITLADEVTAQAEALARARDALHGVESADMSTHAPSGESGPIYDLGVEQQELRDRIQHTWDVPSSEPTITDPLLSDVSLNAGETATASQVPFVGTSESMPKRYTEGSYAIDSGGIENAPDPISPVTSSIKNGVAFVGGLLAGRTRATALKRSLDSTNTRLSAETSAIKHDVEAIQRQSQTHEYIVPELSTNPINNTQAHVIAKQEVMQTPSHPEVSGTDAPAIPSWIRQIENDVKNGKVVELKKWQHDVLRIQHPELLSRYEKLDQSVRQEILHQTKEVLSSQFKSPVSRVPQPLSMPGDLPIPVSSMPAYMSPSRNEPIAPSYSYANSGSPAVSLTLSANGYLTIVMIGGIVFGAALIAAFGF